MAGERFGLFPAPLSMLATAKEKEMLYDPGTGHFYVKKDGVAISKTVENENRLNYMDTVHGYAHHGVTIEGPNWGPLMNTPAPGSQGTSINKDLIITLADTVQANIVTFNNKLNFNVGSKSRYYVALTCRLTAGDGKVIFGVKSFSSSMAETNIPIMEATPAVGKDIILSGIIVGTGTKDNPSGLRFPLSAVSMSPYIVIGEGRTISNTSLQISKIEVFEIPDYLALYKGFKRSYLTIDTDYDTSLGTYTTKPTDEGSSTGKVFRVASNALNPSILSIETTDLRPGLYSVAIRVKVSANTLTNKGLVISAYKDMGTSSRAYASIASKTIPFSAFNAVNTFTTVYAHLDLNDKPASDWIKFQVDLSFDASGVVASIDYITIMEAAAGAFSY